MGEGWEVWEVWENGEVWEVWEVEQKFHQNVAAIASRLDLKSNNYNVGVIPKFN
ncbi:MAG: hypothetical protein F6K40_10970 [Okeania sp. SIO3I5]|uniref:hypothetical protein n=1 Tax=Okeania sp. SIO3I5 TaxID=2607805 RepID=UPI0013BE3980|nr:hypothetical protein [Okeania sp. SIO3I5]NEQ36772.1 hypothetical protein [Okeania sp. SIO3I5]